MTTSTEPQSTDGKEVPSREEVIAWYKDQIEISELRERLARSQSKIIQHDTKRMHHLGLMAQMQGNQPEKNNSPTDDSQQPNPAHDKPLAKA